ncbi:MAG TPA: PhnD/SsuA/transferrin family substrate-binding protein, partial [Candidatus Omnitrophota bacterium]|nr:PhnD/SsuA/transferrin family substrate-binding protein [Candidatus Omnitrophota bacterium]
WQPTIRHLNAALPQYVFRAVPLDIPGLTRAVEAGEVAFAVTNPGHYVELEARHRATRIATAEIVGGPSPAAALGAAIVVRADRADLRTIDDLRGRRIAAVLPEAFGGFRLAWREMAARGIDPFRDATMAFLGFPIEGIVEAVARGDADAGVVRACLLEKLAEEGRVHLADFNVLPPPDDGGLGCRHSTRLYPDWPFAKQSATPDALAKQVGVALLSMPPEAGHAWTVPVDYQPVHELFHDLKIGPYDYLARRTLADTLRDYWPWLVAGGMAAVWWVAHVVRVEYLVRRRTEELKSAHREARRQREELEHGARLALLGEMASSIAHEINQPLAAIANYASGCQRRLEAGTDADGVTEGLRMIAGQAERAAGIVKRIRAFVRKQGPEATALDLNDVVLDAVDLFRGVAARRGVTVETALAPTLPRVAADRLQVEQVLLNLLQNAADAMAGGDRRRVEVATAAAESGMVEVAVTDSGPGLAPEMRDRLFEPFFTTKPDGVGLGLSLSRSIVEAHGGRLRAEDGPDCGARFRFTLPAFPTEPA